MHIPLNDLEQALQLAAANPEHRPAFYKTLMVSQVLVIGFADPSSQQNAGIRAGQPVSITTWNKSDGTPIVPFFRACRHCNGRYEARSGIWLCPLRASLN